jgi:hypothetical protein
MDNVVETYTDALRLTDVSLRVVGGQVNVDSKRTILPDKVHFHDSDVINCSPDTPQSETKTLQVTFQTARSIQMTRAVSHSQQITAKVGFTFEHVGSADLTISGTDSVTLTNQTAQTVTETISASDQVTVTAAPLKRAQVSLQVIEGGIQSTFHAKLVADGPVDANIDGISVASQVLSESERTFDVDGILTVTSASQSKVLRHDTSLTAAFCAGKPQITITDLNDSLNVGSVSTLLPTATLLSGQTATLTADTIDKLLTHVGSVSVAGRGNPPLKQVVEPFGDLLSDAEPESICFIGLCDPVTGTRVVCFADDEGACAVCRRQTGDSSCKGDRPPQ